MMDSVATMYTSCTPHLPNTLPDPRAGMTGTKRQAAHACTTRLGAATESTLIHLRSHTRHSPLCGWASCKGGGYYQWPPTNTHPLATVGHRARGEGGAHSLARQVGYLRGVLPFTVHTKGAHTNMLNLNLRRRPSAPRYEGRAPCSALLCSRAKVVSITLKD